MARDRKPKRLSQDFLLPLTIKFQRISALIDFGCRKRSTEKCHRQDQPVGINGDAVTTAMLQQHGISLTIGAFPGSTWEQAKNAVAHTNQLDKSLVLSLGDGDEVAIGWVSTSCCPIPFDWRFQTPPAINQCVGIRCDAARMSHSHPRADLD